MIYDLAVIGGGPAGASAAITAARAGLRVVLCERSAMAGDSARDKVCGEFVSAEALPLVAAYAPELLAAAPAITEAVLVLGRGRRVGFALPQAGRGISRLALDAALWRAAGAAGAELRPRTAVARWRPAGHGFRLECAAGGAVLARAVVDTRGRGTGASAWLGLKARFAGLEPTAAVELYALRGGYCGVAPVENGWTNVCCFLDCRRAPALAASRDVARHFSSGSLPLVARSAGFDPRQGPPAGAPRFSKLPQLAAWLGGVGGSAALCARLAGGRQATPTVAAARLELGPRPALARGALAAGDASGFVDPFTGDGIARALLSGRLAAEAVAGGEAARYPAALARAARGGFHTAAALRLVAAAPGWAQSLAAPLLAHPALASRLVRATRWRTL